MPTFRDYSGRTITTDLTREEIARRFADAPETEYSWYWMTRWVTEHLSRAEQQAAQTAALRAVQPTAGTLHRSINFLGDLFLLANGRGLQRPRLRLHYKEMRFKVYLVRPRKDNRAPYGSPPPPVTICFTSGDLVYSHEKGCMDPVGDERYVGCLSPVNGQFIPARVQTYGRSTAWQEGRYMPWSRLQYRDVLPLEQEFLERMAADPIGFMAECSRNMGQCCYCGLPLEDDRSKTVGYGPVCANKWGLPWGDHVSADQGKSFAQAWGESSDVRGLCASVRAEPRDALRWQMLDDALIDAGVWGGGVSMPDAVTFDKFLIPAVVEEPEGVTV